MTSNYRLGYDEPNWTIERRYVHGDRSRTPGKVEWRPFAWFGGNLKQAALSLHDFHTRENYAEMGIGIGRLLEAIQQAQNSVMSEVERVVEDRPRDMYQRAGVES